MLHFVFHPHSHSISDPFAFLPFRNAVSAVVAKVQYNAFISRAKGLFEEDRSLFGLLVALEIEDSNHRLEIGERAFLVSPPFGAAIRQLANPEWEIPAKTLVKKPFDWLMDEQYHNLQVSLISVFIVNEYLQHLFCYHK